MNFERIALVWVCLALAGLLLRDYFPGYLRRKGANLADKEDITTITRLTEQVKHVFAEQHAILVAQNAVLLEALRSRQQLRIAAIDRRLEVHQEAFVLWRQLMRTHEAEEIGPLVAKCQSWWEENCLYLEPDAREAFSKAYFAAHMRPWTRLNAHAVDQAANWRDISAAGDVIMKAVKMPELKEWEAEIGQQVEATGAADVLPP